MSNNEMPEVLRADCPYRYKLCECGAFDCPCACDCETCADRDECLKKTEPTTMDGKTYEQLREERNGAETA